MLNADSNCRPQGGSFKESSVSRAMAVRETVTVGRKGGSLKRAQFQRLWGQGKGEGWDA